MRKCNAFEDDGESEEVGRRRYAAMQQLWRDRGFTCLRDLLEYYNNGNVLGFVTALERQREFFRDIQNLDMLKDAFTLPGLALAFAFNSTEHKFKLVSDPKVNRLIRDNVVGGPAIVFHRHAKVGETQISHQIDPVTDLPVIEAGQSTVRSIVGYDANALYLWAFAQAMPVGEYHVLSADDGFAYGRVCRSWR